MAGGTWERILSPGLLLCDGEHRAGAHSRVLSSVMKRLVWFVLRDGRSVVAECGVATKESLQRALANPSSIVKLTSDEMTSEIIAGDIRDFVVFESKAALRAPSSVHRIVHV